MLPAIHRTLRRLIYERGNIDQREVEITFETPTRERNDRLMRPAIHLFLHDIQENRELRHGNTETMHSNGRVIRRQAARRFDLCYMVCAITADIEDEHLLLWRTLTTLVRYPQLPAELLEAELQALEIPLSTRLYQEDELQKQLSIWNALQMPLHSAFYYVITAPIEMNQVGEAPLVLRSSLRYSNVQGSENRETKHSQRGGVIKDKQGMPQAGVQIALEGSGMYSITDSEGRFVLQNAPSGSFRVQIVRESGERQNFLLPSESSVKSALEYDITL